MSEWQPIETAPRDFTEILLVWHPPLPVNAEPCVVLARWICRTHVMRAYHGNCPNELDCDEGWDNYAGEFSHWMPLPDPPSEQLYQAGSKALPSQPKEGKEVSTVVK